MTILAFAHTCGPLVTSTHPFGLRRPAHRGNSPNLQA